MSTTSPGASTLNEILSQPEVWAQSLSRFQQLDPAGLPNVRDYDQVLFTGCGSTYYLSLWAARACQRETGVSSQAVPASDLLLSPEAWLQPSHRTLLVATSRSAETTETILALKNFNAGGYGDSVVVTCYPDRQLAKLSPAVIDVPDAQEDSVAQTRSFTNMLLGIGWLVARQVPPDLPSKLSAAGSRLIETYREIAQRIGRGALQRFFYLGSGALYGLACEAMLKMKEMSLSYSEAFHTMEFRHGPMSMVDQETLLVGLIDEAAREQSYAVLREMRAKGARTLGILDRGDSLPPDTLDDPVLLQSSVPGLWQAPLYLPILQLIAYERAIQNGLDPDRPTNLTAVVVLHD